MEGQNSSLIEGNAGISSKFAKSLKNHEIKIGTETKSNIGFYGGHTTGTFSLGTGNITIYGGQDVYKRQAAYSFYVKNNTPEA